MYDHFLIANKSSVTILGYRNRIIIPADAPTTRDSKEKRNLMCMYLCVHRGWIKRFFGTERNKLPSQPFFINLERGQNSLSEMRKKQND